MTDTKQPLLAPGLVDRVMGLLKRPDLEWPVIAAEQTSVKALLRFYALPLALIGPLATLIHEVGFEGENIVEGAIYFIATYGLSLLSAYILGIVIDGMAEHFGSPKSMLSSMKLGVYAMTPFWLIGAFNLISSSLTLVLTLTLGFYGAYLVYCGLGPLKQTPLDQRLGYTVASSVVWMVLTLVVSGLILAFLAAFSIIGQGAAAIIDL